MNPVMESCPNPPRPPLQPWRFRTGQGILRFNVERHFLNKQNIMALAGMIPFATRFPELAARETRTVILPCARGGLPAGRFGFLEFYCDDPECDCRRVLLQVRSKEQPETTLATINYGWESVGFDTKWLHGDRAEARQIKDASLAPINPQSRLAASFLRLLQTVVLRDRPYLAIVAGLCQSAGFKPGDRVKTLRGSLRGTVVRILPDGRVAWHPDGRQTALVALPEGLLRA